MSTTGGHHQRTRDAERIRAAPSRSRSAERRDATQGVAPLVGNRAFTALIARSGAGIMDDGTVHPDVQAAISGAQGGGAALDARTRERFGPQLGDSLADVRVHTDANADALACAVDARAFATGSDVFFARGEHRPGSPDGDRLIAHELTHVVQQRGAPSAGPLTVTEPGDELEREADAVSRELAG